MSGYARDVRQRVLATVERGMPRQDVVTTFAISLGTRNRWLAKHRNGRDLHPGSPPGPQPSITLRIMRRSGCNSRPIRMPPLLNMPHFGTRHMARP